MIGIIGAEAPEVALLLERMTVTRQEQRAGMTFSAGVLSGREVVVSQCGIGKIAAALCVQVMADVFGATAVINTGVAGGLHPELSVGDLVIASDTVQHDFDLTAFGRPMGSQRYVADERLVDAFVRAAAEQTGYKALVGTIASGDAFVHDPAAKQRIQNGFDAAAVEMEGAGVGQAATANGMAYAVIRSISDLADGTATSSYEEFQAEAAKRSAQMVMRALELLDAHTPE